MVTMPPFSAIWPQFLNVDAVSNFALKIAAKLPQMETRLPLTDYRNSSSPYTTVPLLTYSVRQKVAA